METNSSKAGAIAEKQRIERAKEQDKKDDRLKNQPRAEKDRDEMVAEHGFDRTAE